MDCHRLEIRDCIASIPGKVGGALVDLAMPPHDGRICRDQTPNAVALRAGAPILRAQKRDPFLSGLLPFSLTTRDCLSYVGVSKECQ